jgi:hypothetical protein
MLPSQGTSKVLGITNPKVASSTPARPLNHARSRLRARARRASQARGPRRGGPATPPKAGGLVVGREAVGRLASGEA